MVQTGKRAMALARLLEAGGLSSDTSRTGAPRIQDLDASTAGDILRLYRDLGGVQEHPHLRPGAWDLRMDGILIELDEELHFNRYRLLTLNSPWSGSLPWTAFYGRACSIREAECLRAATWGKRWSNPSSARMFGPGAPPGELEAEGGAPRWKQRALYDAIKDAAVLANDLRLARLSIYDDVSGVPLGAALEERLAIDTGELLALLAERTS